MDEYPTINWTWEGIEENWPCPDFMQEQLLKASGKDVNEFTFVQNGRWLIATTHDGKDRFVWDDTSGEWLGRDEIDDEDIEG